MIYRITSETGIFLNDRFIYKEAAVQEWDVQLSGGVTVEYSYAKGYRLVIETRKKPETDFSGHNLFHHLAEFLNKPAAKLDIILDAGCDYVKVDNGDEILSIWNDTKKQIVETFGNREDISTIMEEKEQELENISDEIMNSLLHHICILSFGKGKKTGMTAPSVMIVGENVSVEAERIQEKGQNRVIYTGAGRLRDKSNIKKEYNLLMTETAGNVRFDYAYGIEIEYVYQPDSRFMEQALAKVREQASEKFYYEQVIRFEKVKD